MKTFTNSREANRYALDQSGEQRDWFFVRKPDRFVELYEVHSGKASFQPGDRQYFNGMAMAH